MTALRSLAGGSVLAAMVALGGPAAMAGDGIKDSAQPFSWSGFSVGVHAGAGRGSGDHTITGDGLDFIKNFGKVELEGGFAGASLARDWQVGQVVFGIVVDISKSDVGGFATSDVDVLQGYETKIDWFGTVRGKLGYAAGPYLLYATGGLAYGQVEATLGNLVSHGTFNPFSGVVSGKDTRVGWAAGGGIDVSVANNWVLGVEYLYVDLGGAMTLTGLRNLNTIASPVDVDADIHTVRANLRYKF